MPKLSTERDIEQIPYLKENIKNMQRELRTLKRKVASVEREIDRNISRLYKFENIRDNMRSENHV